MKKLIQIVFFPLAVTLSGVEGSAKNYYPLVDTNKVWSIGQCYCGGWASWSTGYWKIYGDTTFNSLLYKKVWTTGDSTLNTGWSIDGLIREDSIKKIFYYYLFDSQEYLLYDFDLNQ